MNINITNRIKLGKALRVLPFCFLALLLAGSMASCSDDTIDGPSIFTNDTTKVTAFDNWIDTSFTKPYNIRFIYKYVDGETDNAYNVVPPDEEKAQGAAQLIKYMWIDAYREVMGADFVRNYAPRIYQLIGSNQYNSNGSETMGLAEGGVKITLFGINYLDLNDILINNDDSVPDRSINPIDANYKILETIHHEFCHILTQQKDYATTFRTISAGNYHTADWINVGDTEAPGLGFVTNYASSEYNEDFAEVYANYVTKSDKGWNGLLRMAGEEGSATILSKLELVRSYMRTQWGLDIDKLREVVQRRTAEARLLDLHTLN